MKPVCVSTWSLPGQKFFDAFLITAARNGIDPQNADPNFWAGTSWQDKEWFRKSEAQAKFVRDTMDRYTHFLFCDSYDILFAAGWDEIMMKFERLNSPIVFGAESYPWPKTEQAVLYPPTEHRCKYLNAGFWMGTAQAALAFLEDIEKVAAKREQCDQGIAVDAFLSKRHPIVLDTACSLLFCCNINSLDFLELTPGKRPMTRDTMEQPCLFHGNGNSPLMPILQCLDSIPKSYKPTPEETERMAQ